MFYTNTFIPTATDQFPCLDPMMTLHQHPLYHDNVELFLEVTTNATKKTCNLTVLSGLVVCSCQLDLIAPR